jgi:hypothetical protein
LAKWKKLGRISETGVKMSEEAQEVIEGIKRRMREAFLAGLEKPKPKAELKVCSENELSIETQRGRLRDQAERLFEEEKRRLAAEVAAAITGRQQPGVVVTRKLHQGPMSGELQQRYQGAVDNWVRFQRQAAAYERQFRKELDPLNLGIYGVEPFHAGGKDD